jgi:hypothetical protein
MYNDIYPPTQAMQQRYALSRIPMFNRNDLSNKSFYRTTYSNSFVPKQEPKDFNPYAVDYLRHRQSPPLIDEYKIFRRKKDSLENLGKFDSKLNEPFRQRDFRRKDFLNYDKSGFNTGFLPITPATTETREAFNNVLFNGLPDYRRPLNSPQKPSGYITSNASYGDNLFGNTVNNNNASPRSYEYNPISKQSFPTSEPRRKI